jgi:hypothetical protein
MDYDMDMDDDAWTPGHGKRPREQGSSEDSDTNSGTNQLGINRETYGDNQVHWLISGHVSGFTIVSSAGYRVVQSGMRCYRVHTTPTEITSQG